jgi:hydroxymethylpyrimidine/phosphomethylpyrimidine kinase
LADAKTFEQHHMDLQNTGNTIQTENEFFEIQWTDLDFVLKSEKLFENYNIKAAQTGEAGARKRTKTLTTFLSL